MILALDLLIAAWGLLPVAALLVYTLWYLRTHPRPAIVTASVRQAPETR